MYNLYEKISQDQPRIPSKTIKGYKLFKLKGGKLYPLYVNATTEVPIGKWIKAESGELLSSGKVKSKLGGLAYRPGWHSGVVPVASHIGGKSHGNPKLPPDYRRDDEVWAEVEISDDVDWQDEASKRARIGKSGKIVASTAHITDQVPYGGYYRYKTNSNMTGEWLISGEIKVNKILTDKEVEDINNKYGVKDLPRLTNKLKENIMDVNVELGKAVLDASESRPKDFADRISSVVSFKMKDKLSAFVKEEEKRIFKKHK